MDVSTSGVETLNSLYMKIQSNFKNSSPLWEDLVSKTAKLHNAIKNVLVCSAVFWDSFQKIADCATEAQGSTKEIGTSFTRLCMRQKMIDTKLKMLNQNLLGTLSGPIQEKMEDWKKCANQLEKERIKETKKAKAEWKRASEASVRLQKKAVKRGSLAGLGPLENEVQSALKSQTDKFAKLQYAESVSLRKAMTHERERFCFLFTSMRPVLECEVSLLEDMTSLNEMMKTLDNLTASVDRLPVESEQVIQQIIDPEVREYSQSNCNLSGNANTVFSSGFGSRKSSVASLNSSQSLSSSSGPSVAPRDATDISGVGLRASHLSMASSVHEPSGYSGDYRVSDDDTRNSTIVNAQQEDDDDEYEDDDEDNEDDDEEEEDEDSEDAKTPSSPTVSLWSEKLSAHADTGHHKMRLSSRQHHTVSGTREHNRQQVSASVFDPPIQQWSTNSMKPDQSKQLYPNQAIPLPIYTNLKELTNTAQKKYSMNLGSPIINQHSHPTDESSQQNVNPIYSLSPSGSKTPGIRRMTLPEIVTTSKYAVPVNRTEPPPVSVSGQQSSTLTRQGNETSGTGSRNCGYPQTSNSNVKSHRSTSVCDKPGSPLYEANEAVSDAKLRHNSLMNELMSHNSRQQSTEYNSGSSTATTTTNTTANNNVNNTQQQIPSDYLWTDIDPDLPMPPPPSSVEEEIRLASIPPPM